jgi:hypothetical protein
MTNRLALISILVAVIVAAGPARVVAQDRDDPKGMTKIIARAIASGDSRTLSELSAGQIEIDLGEGSSVYTRDQARYVFASFFDDHPPSDFTFGGVKVLNELSTARGKYFSIDSNQPWDAFIRLGMADGKWRMKEIQFSGGLQTQRQLPPRTMFELSPR